MFWGKEQEENSEKDKSIILLLGLTDIKQKVRFGGGGLVATAPS